MMKFNFFEFENIENKEFKKNNLASIFFEGFFNYKKLKKILQIGNYFRKKRCKNLEM